MASILVLIVALLAGVAVLSLIVGMRSLVLGGSGDLSNRLGRYGAVEQRPMVNAESAPEMKGRKNPLHVEVGTLHQRHQ